jgi:hypothetical protein
LVLGAFWISSSYSGFRILAHWQHGEHFSSFPWF